MKSAALYLYSDPSLDWSFSSFTLRIVKMQVQKGPSGEDDLILLFLFRVLRLIIWDLLNVLIRLKMKDKIAVSRSSRLFLISSLNNSYRLILPQMLEIEGIHFKKCHLKSFS